MLLKIDNVHYKFLSIFYSKKDPSYYLYNHLKDKKGSLVVTEPFHLLSTSGSFSPDALKNNLVEDGDSVHLSVHPTRLYLKKRTKEGKEEHLIEEQEPQPFNESGFRLHCVFTPGSIMALEICDPSTKKNNEELIIFEWVSSLCPQISVYELNNLPNIVLPEGLAIKIIDSDGLHPQVALHLKAISGDIGIWRPSCVVFGKIIKKAPITKAQLEKIISYNKAGFDISSIPDDAIISDYKIVQSK